MTTHARSAAARLTLLALGLVLAACNAGPGAQPPETFEGRAFLSMSVTEKGVSRPLIDGTRIRLGFGDGRLTASAGCNSMGGNYTLTAGQLLVADLATTDMGCDRPRHDQDEWLAAFLASKPTARLSGTDLTLEADGTVIVLQDREIAEPDLPLVGTRWTLVSLIEGETASSIPAAQPPTLEFSPDGRVTIFAGCNQGSGSYTADAPTIRFSAIAITKKGCEASLMQLEQSVLEVLGAESVTYAIEASSLDLVAGDGGLQFQGAAAA